MQQPQGPMHFLEVFPGALSPEQCEDIIARFEADETRAHSRTALKVNPKVRTGTMVETLNRPDWADVTSLMEGVIRDKLALYVGKYESLKGMTDPRNFTITAPLIERIDPGQGFDWHIDAGPANTSNRFLTTLTYLRDVPEGGTTEFPYQQVAVPPRAGMMVVFPPFWTHLHRGAPVKSGIKYNVTNFLLLKPEWTPPDT